MPLHSLPNNLIYFLLPRSLQASTNCNYFTEWLWTSFSTPKSNLCANTVNQGGHRACDWPCDSPGLRCCTPSGTEICQLLSGSPPDQEVDPSMKTALGLHLWGLLKHLKGSLHSSSGRSLATYGKIKKDLKKKKPKECQILYWSQWVQNKTVVVH